MALHHYFKNILLCISVTGLYIYVMANQLNYTLYRLNKRPIKIYADTKSSSSSIQSITGLCTLVLNVGISKVSVRYKEII